MLWNRPSKDNGEGSDFRFELGVVLKIQQVNPKNTSGAAGMTSFQFNCIDPYQQQTRLVFTQYPEPEKSNIWPGDQNWSTRESNPARSMKYCNFSVKATAIPDLSSICPE